MLRIVLILVFINAFGASHAGPLFDASVAGDTDEVERLLTEAAAVDERGQNQATPLIAASLAGNTDVAMILLENGADIGARNKGGLTALHAAAYSGSTDIIGMLLERGANIEDSENIAGATPLLLAAEENHLETAQHLIEAGADVTVVDRDGLSILTQAWAKRHAEMVALLKKHGATCQTADILGSEEYWRLCTEMGN